MKLFLFITGFTFLVFSQISFAKPILNRTVTATIHPDSINPDIYWMHPTEFNICGLDNGDPVFSIRAFKLNDSPRTFITFDICPKHDTKRIREYQEVIQKINPKGQLKFIQAYYNEDPKVEFAMQKDFGITALCSRGRVKEAKFSCGAFAMGERRADRLYNYFRETQMLLSAQYLKYHVDGVEQDESGHFIDLVKQYNAVVYVRGLSDYPQLFNTDWKP